MSSGDRSEVSGCHVEAYGGQTKWLILPNSNSALLALPSSKGQCFESCTRQRFSLKSPIFHVRVISLQYDEWDECPA